MDEIAIKIDNVSKEYRLGAIGGGTLKGDLQSLWARIRKKEDPNSKIGSDTNIKIGERFLALDGISFEVKKGEAVGIIGHNGAGKSTLLKLLSRVTAPTKGTIGYNGRIASMLEVGTGFHPELTGRENVYMNGAILGMTKAEIDKKFDEIVEFAEMKQFIDTPVKRYSSGMYVKLAFSVAAHLDSEIMIMDEVLAVGDMKFQKKCLDKMRDAAKQDGRTVLYVSHNMNTIRKLCDRCIVLDNGKVIFEGDVEEAIQLYLGRNIQISQCINYTEKDQPDWCDHKMYIDKTVIKNDLANMYCGDCLNLEVNYTSIDNVNNLRVRLVIVDETGEIVGMSLSDKVFSIVKGQKGKLKIEFDTKYLASGKYSARISVFEMNEYGTHEYICVINNFIVFILNDKPSLHSEMNWDTRSWGHIAFDDFKLRGI